MKNRRYRANRIICYADYMHKGISVYKENDYETKSYITINKEALLEMVDDDMITRALINCNYENYYNHPENIVGKIRHIIRTNDEYADYRKVKDIYMVR